VIIDNQTPYLIHLAASRDERMPTRKGVVSFAHHLSPYPTLPPTSFCCFWHCPPGGQKTGRRRTLYLYVPPIRSQVWIKRCVVCGWDGGVHALCVPAVAMLWYRG
jgi:hypothetical protein